MKLHVLVFLQTFFAAVVVDVVVMQLHFEVAETTTLLLLAKIFRSSNLELKQHNSYWAIEQSAYLFLLKRFDYFSAFEKEKRKKNFFEVRKMFNII